MYTGGCLLNTIFSSSPLREPKVHSRTHASLGGEHVLQGNWTLPPTGLILSISGPATAVQCNSHGDLEGDCWTDIFLADKKENTRKKRPFFYIWVLSWEWDALIMAGENTIKSQVLHEDLGLMYVPSRMALSLKFSCEKKYVCLVQGSYSAGTPLTRHIGC